MLPSLEINYLLPPNTRIPSDLRHPSTEEPIHGSAGSGNRLARRRRVRPGNLQNSG